MTVVIVTLVIVTVVIVTVLIGIVIIVTVVIVMVVIVTVVIVAVVKVVIVTSLSKKQLDTLTTDAMFEGQRFVIHAMFFFFKYIFLNMWKMRSREIVNAGGRH